MARFDDFTPKEKHILREAMAWAQPEFYDPGHTPEDRDTLHALIMEAKASALNTTRAAESPAETPETENDPQVEEAAKTATEPAAAPEMSSLWQWPNETSVQSTSKKPTRKVAQDERPAWNEPAQYKGFLYVECRKCGQVHAFCAKVPMSIYRCRECGGQTPLVNMHRLMVTCECGGRHNYMTNIAADQMDVDCFSCGAPVAVEWNDKAKRYETMGAYTPSRKKGVKR